MSWLRRWRRASAPGEEERRALEDWVRRRFQLAASDPMTAIIGAIGRLTDTGMTADDATDTVLRLLSESEQKERPRPLRPTPWESSTQPPGESEARRFRADLGLRP